LENTLKLIPPRSTVAPNGSGEPRLNSNCAVTIDSSFWRKLDIRPNRSPLAALSVYQPRVHTPRSRTAIIRNQK
jgi:predicted nucleic acid binding AN1-type Zn finger protein